MAPWSARCLLSCTVSTRFSRNIWVETLLWKRSYRLSGLRRAKSSEDSLFNWEGFKAKLPSRTTTAAIDESYLVELSCSRGSKSYSENSRNLENAWQSLRELNAF